MDEQKKDLFTERAANALEGIEMLIAMWIEKSVPAGELWVGEGPDRDLSRRPWRTSDFGPSRATGLEVAPDRIRHIEERLDSVAIQLATLESRVHEELAE